MIFLAHPSFQRYLSSIHKQHLQPLEARSKSYLDAWVDKDIILDSAPETREVEIFELQKLTTAGEWEHWVFSQSPYDPLCEGRLKGERAKGTRFFEDVRAPGGWEWSEKKWMLDLWSREWVEERIITGVEVETEGERWVYDLRYEGGDGMGMGFGGSSNRGSVDGGSSRVSLDEKGKRKVLPSWEEWSGGEGDAGGWSDIEGESRRRRGEWRRRRWVRLVRRKWVNREEAEGLSGRFPGAFAGIL